MHTVIEINQLNRTKSLNLANMSQNAQVQEVDFTERSYLIP